jgi:hypothetical protein
MTRRRGFHSRPAWKVPQYSRALDQGGTTIFDHIGLRVKDIEKAKKLYAPTYYGAFLLDGEGNNVEAVCYR